ncbi:MAG: hypothetical protein WDO74_32595 [Pseudomonadota bacterium]
MWLGVASVATLWTAGCYKATFVQSPSDLERKPTQVVWSNHYFFGLAGEPEFDARASCPHGVAVVRTGGDVATGVSTILTLGIYAPRKVYLTCSNAAPKGGIEL